MEFRHSLLLVNNNTVLSVNHLWCSLYFVVEVLHTVDVDVRHTAAPQAQSTPSAPTVLILDILQPSVQRSFTAIIAGSCGRQQNACHPFLNELLVFDNYVRYDLSCNPTSPPNIPEITTTAIDLLIPTTTSQK